MRTVDKKNSCSIIEGASAFQGDIIAVTKGARIKSLHSNISTKTGERV